MLGNYKLGTMSCAHYEGMRFFLLLLPNALCLIFKKQAHQLGIGM
jgi:hypothetical protein